ncbi:MAG: hypothetical protein UY02_C0015G0011 [Candidatus Giovannonibacteria bacterium GW2011_GWB1_47_6b]|uniref:Uncharacterized protein n=1 Tax=Candidatus Giovannonibacteria bacterium GW2011_GWB1_47_6b TaxID=1618655 RepID=A0A0G1T4D1_9BACT|nr:MAG: hypothetical protein UY02_C0015G0011 [Candidatus Giovannonibacteria bacterium GW2011_GWB1_47_6b]
MFIVITTISIVAITGLVWGAKKILPFPVCPICAGVSGTWLWMLGLRFLGYPIDIAVLAMLLGGSVVGIAYQIDKRLPDGRLSMAWKALFIPLGFVAAYSLVYSWWQTFGIMVLGLAALALIFLKLSSTAKGHPEHDKRVRELEEKMKKCC